MSWSKAEGWVGNWDLCKCSKHEATYKHSLHSTPPLFKGLWRNVNSFLEDSISLHCCYIFHRDEQICHAYETEMKSYFYIGEKRFLRQCYGHSWYKSLPPPPAVVCFFQASAPFSIENTKLLISAFHGLLAEKPYLSLYVVVVPLWWHPNKSPYFSTYTGIKALH